MFDYAQLLSSFPSFFPANSSTSVVEHMQSFRSTLYALATNTKCILFLHQEKKYSSCPIDHYLWVVCTFTGRKAAFLWAYMGVRQ